MSESVETVYVIHCDGAGRWGRDCTNRVDSPDSHEIALDYARKDGYALGVTIRGERLDLCCHCQHAAYNAGLRRLDLLHDGQPVAIKVYGTMEPNNEIVLDDPVPGPVNEVRVYPARCDMTTFTHYIHVTKVDDLRLRLGGQR